MNVHTTLTTHMTKRERKGERHEIDLPTPERYVLNTIAVTVNFH